MASLSASRQPAASAASSCLGCLARRSSRPSLFAAATTLAPSSSSSSSPLSAPFLPLQQTRGKKVGIRHDNGVVVRLLQDVPQFGPRDTILRTERGRMRNLWFPRKMAEYMTTARLAAMGVTNPEDVIVPRDHAFVLEKNDGSSDSSTTASSSPSQRQQQPSIQIQTIDPARAAALLETMLPTKLVFFRKPISSSPSASTAAAAAAADSLAIFGSVSAGDVATSLREALRMDREASLIRVESRDVRFVMTEADKRTPGSADSDSASTPDRLKRFGKWEVEITVRGHTGRSEEGVPPVRKIVEVVAQKD